MRQLLRRLEEQAAAGAGIGPKDVALVGEPHKETRRGPQGRNLADEWRVGQLFRVGDVRYMVVTSWKGTAWDAAAQKALVRDMRDAVAQQARTRSSRLVLTGSGQWTLP